jgi:type IV pilus assembly protein PilM
MQTAYQEFLAIIPSLTRKKENLAIIDIGYKSSSITILDRGKLFIEKEISSGIEDAVGIISRKLNLNHEEAYTYLFESMNISNVDQNNDAQLGVQILFEDAFSTFEKVIQFYSSENLQQKIDKVYITGGGSELLGIDAYANNYMNLPVLMIDQSLLDSIGIKIPDNCDVNIYINTIGLMLRKE